MSDTPFLGEIRLASFNFAPSGWAMCNGQLLPINSNQPLFSLLGTSYGGDGRVNFALPDLRGRVAISQGAGYTRGQALGEESHTVSMNEMPAHNHLVDAMPGAAASPSPAANLLAGANNLYGSFNDLTTLHPATIGNVGGGQPHENRQPYLVLNYMIALIGLFPSQT